MADLISINIFLICLDILTVIIVVLSQRGISRLMQTFSHILKLKLKFAVPNQLMIVAARGVNRKSFAKQWYHHNYNVIEEDTTT